MWLVRVAMRVTARGSVTFHWVTSVLLAIVVSVCPSAEKASSTSGGSVEPTGGGGMATRSVAVTARRGRVAHLPQVWLADSRDGGTVWAAGRSLPEMSLAFALMAAINGSTGSSVKLSYRLNFCTKPYRRLSGGRPRFLFLMGGGASRRGRCPEIRRYL